MKDLTAEFQKHEDNRVKLSEILKNPVFINAVQALKAELDAYPGGAAETNPVIAASRYQQIAGVNHIILGLQRLTEAPEAKKAPRAKTLPTSVDDIKR